MIFNRTEKSRFADWAFTIDQMLLTALMSLVVIGSVLSFAASPAVAIKKGFDTYYFVHRHVVFAVLSAGIMIAVSFLSPSGDSKSDGTEDRKTS